ncbi:MAG: hypothetical protein E7559_09315, partial [Ruminococcaceae bacterium]|nr:hypothetical protein [Oscillospiraceae bacterium]
MGKKNKKAKNNHNTPNTQTNLTAATIPNPPKKKNKPIGEPENPQIGWMRLDNAAKIYPASTRRSWTPMFRISTTFTEPVDVEVLQSALEKTLRRFPGIAVALKAGLFWNYLDPIKEMPKVQPEGPCPCLPMSRKNLKKCAVRVLYYENRIAVEYFHSLTDGTGGLIFMKTLAAEYLTQKYHIDIPCEEGICDRNEQPKPEELEDSFINNAGSFTDGSRDTVSYRLRGTKEPDGFINLTTGIMDAKAV